MSIRGGSGVSTFFRHFEFECREFGFGWEGESLGIQDFQKIFFSKDVICYSFEVSVICNSSVLLFVAVIWEGLLFVTVYFFPNVVCNT